MKAAGKGRIIFFRTATVLVLIAIAAWMFVIGRGHTVYFDSKALEYNGKTAEAPYKMEVYVNDERVAKLYEGERGMCDWIGQNFKMIVEVTKEKGGKSIKQSVAMTLPYNMDGIILNMPALLSGMPAEAYISEFVAAPVTEEPEEEIETDEFGITNEMEETEEVPEE